MSTHAGESDDEVEEKPDREPFRFADDGEGPGGTRASDAESMGRPAASVEASSDSLDSAYEEYVVASFEVAGDGDAPVFSDADAPVFSDADADADAENDRRTDLGSGARDAPAPADDGDDRYDRVAGGTGV